MTYGDLEMPCRVPELRAGAGGGRGEDAQCGGAHRTAGASQNAHERAPDRRQTWRERARLLSGLRLGLLHLKKSLNV